MAQSARALLLGAFVVAAATLAVAVEPARACSCVPPDPWALLAQADGAFVGRLVSRAELGDRAVLVFSVERAVKGELGDTVEVETARSSAACGLETPVGDRVGLFLGRDGGRWVGSLCAQVAPDELLAATVLPAPNGRGPAALFVGGRFGPARSMVLDAQGRTLAYGLDAGSVSGLSVCPGGSRVAEVAKVPDGREITIRDTRSLGVVRRRPLRLPGWRVVSAVQCEDGSGLSVLLFSGLGGDSPLHAAIHRVEGRRLEVVWQGTAYPAILRSPVTYLSAGPHGVKLLAVNVRTGRVTRAGSLPGETWFLTADDTGKHVAGVDTSHAVAAGESRVVLAELEQRPPRVRAALVGSSADFGHVFWLPSGRLLYLPWFGSGTARVLDRSLRAVSQFRWSAGPAAVAGSTAYGIDADGDLLAAKLPSGPTRVLRRLPGRPDVIASATP